MNIIPRGPSIGEIIGQGLSDLAGHFAERHTSTKALKGLGFSDAQAKAYAHLGPQVQQQAIHALQQRQQQEASNAAINQILGQGLPAVQPYQQLGMQAQQQPQQQNMMQRQLPHEQQQAALQQATSIAQNPAFRKLQEQQQGSQALQQQQLARQLAPQQQQQPITGEQAAILQSQAQQNKEPSLKEQIEQVRNQKRALSAANLPANQVIALHQQLEAKEKELRKEERENRKEEREERKFSAEEQREIDKETSETYKDVSKAYKSAKDSNMRLGRMEELIKGGKLSSNLFIRGAKALGKIPFVGGIFEAIGESMTNPDTQEFDKLSTDFVKDAKQFFGNRITETEVELFLKTVPTLFQTDAGKKRVIRNMRLFNEAAQVRKKVMDEIIKENKGRRPRNLDSLIEERSSEKLDALAQEFRKVPYAST